MIERGLAEQGAVVLNAMKAVKLSTVDERCRVAAEDHYDIAENISRRVHDLLLAI